MATSKEVEGKIWPQVLAILFGSLAPVSNGLFFCWPSPFILKISKDKENYDITEKQASFFTVIPSVAMMISCIFFSKLSDIIGRKPTLLLIAVPHTLSWILIAMAKSVYVFYAARLCSGIADGIFFATLPSYIGEISTPNVRGTWGNAMTSFLYFGMFLINVIGSFFSVKQTAYICLPIPIIFFSLFIFMPESPYFCMMKGRYDDARKSLKRLGLKRDIEEDFLKLKADVERQMSESGSWKDLFMVHSNRRALIAGTFLRASQQFGGISVLVIYNQFIFEKSGTNINKEVSSIIYMALCFCLNICAGYTVDKLGRRISYMWSAGLCSIVLLLEAVYLYLDQNHPELEVGVVKWMPLLGMILYIIFGSFGLGIIPTLMLGELFSASIKGKGMTVLMFVFCITVFSTNSIFYALNSKIGLYAPFLFFGLSNMVATVVAYHLVPETKGKTLEEIQQLLKGKMNHNNLQGDIRITTYNSTPSRVRMAEIGSIS
ncbi:unnamed protein product [Phaedon cochleariae]|uniref:Major facilitator superfamily (MFS) profile domain-containing protein n=1 Tax=Phaedon cochleariae TaxID=80249 RepID=A0A9P0DP73_PHACE|nr:unnamed protein product [Phaedon cochleariae]